VARPPTRRCRLRPCGWSDTSPASGRPRQHGPGRAGCRFFPGFLGVSTQGLKVDRTRGYRFACWASWHLRWLVIRSPALLKTRHDCGPALPFGRQTLGEGLRRRFRSCRKIVATPSR
jgi:hypothetical protein